MKRILTVGLLLCLLILSASSSTVLLHNQWDDDNDPPETTTGGKKGHIEVVVDRTITDLGSSAKSFVSSTVLIEPAGTQDSSFVAFGQVRGIADKNSALNPLYIPSRARWKKVSSTGVPEWISESELNRTRKTMFVRRPPAPNERLLYSAAEKHTETSLWLSHSGVSHVGETSRSRLPVGETSRSRCFHKMKRFLISLLMGALLAVIIASLFLQPPDDRKTLIAEWEQLGQVYNEGNP